MMRLHNSSGTSYTSKFRAYDASLGQWLSVDPKPSPWESSYMGMGNNPIWRLDPDDDRWFDRASRRTAREMRGELRQARVNNRLNGGTIADRNEISAALKRIFDFYKEKSLQGAKKVKSDLLQAPKAIHYSEQYQVDEMNPKYRRIVVRDFKILYTETKEEVRILDVISTRQSPDILKSK